MQRHENAWRDPQRTLLAHEEPDPEGSTASKVPRRHPIPWPSMGKPHWFSNRKSQPEAGIRGVPLRSKITAYFAIVLPDMEYATPIWDPYLRKDIDALEKVQCKAAQWVKHNILTMSASPVSWPNWNGYRRRITMLCLLQKMHTGAVNLNFKRYFNIDYSTRTTGTGSWINPDGQLVNHKLHRPQLIRPLYRNVPKTWNNLPGDIIAKSTTDTLRSLLERHPWALLRLNPLACCPAWGSANYS